MKQICELNDKIVLGTEGLSTKAPRITARAIVKNQDGLYAVMYADKFKLHSLPGGGVEDGEDVLTALRREVYEETGCVCDEIQELGIVTENRASLDYTQINYYFVVTTTHTPGNNHLTEAEQDSRSHIPALPLRPPPGFGIRDLPGCSILPFRTRTSFFA